MAETKRQFGADVYDDDWIRPDGCGGIFIGHAHIPRDQILGVINLIYRVADDKHPIVLPRFLVSDRDFGQGWTATRIGDELRVATDGRNFAPGQVREIAAVLASFADRITADVENRSEAS